jgi:hypothetical protein
VVHLANAHLGWVLVVVDLISVKMHLLGVPSGEMAKSLGQIGKSE